MIIAADNLHALNPVVSEALRKLDAKPLKDLAVRCEKAGADVIDINPGYLSRRNEDRMDFMVEAVQEATSVRLMLDSPNPRLLARGLAVCRTKPILNAVFLEEEKLREVLPMAAEHSTPLVLLLMDEKSFSPAGMEEKITLAIELREHALAAGLRQEDLIFDPILPNLSWYDGFPRVTEVVRTVQMLASGAVFQEPVRTMAGLSNLRSGLRRLYPLTVDTTCLCILAGAGLQLVLANVLDRELMETFRLVNRMSRQEPKALP